MPISEPDVLPEPMDAAIVAAFEPAPQGGTAGCARARVGAGRGWECCRKGSAVPVVEGWHSSIG